VASRNTDRGDTRAQILRAALEWAGESGLVKFSMGALAKQSRLARATLYQHFTGRDAVVDAVVESELEKFYAAIHSYVETNPGNTDRLVAGFGFAYGYLRRHRALQQVLRVAPQRLLPYVQGESAQMEQGRRFFVAEIRRGEYRPDADVDALADYVVRQLHSLLLAPLPDHPDGHAAAGRAYAERFVVPARAQFVADNTQFVADEAPPEPI
jgi:AcrR family transcriptional regulator